MNVYDRPMVSETVLLFLLIVACCVAAYCVVGVMRRRRDTGWPEAVGRVESYSSFHHLDNEGSRMLSFADVSYRYTVNGQRYSGQFFSPALPSDDTLSAYLRQYLPVGKAVKIRYDPQHPERSILGEELSARVSEITRLHIE